MIRPVPMPDRWSEIRRLRRERPHSRLVRASCVLLHGLGAYAWLGGEVQVADLLSERRWDNLVRFVERDAMPFPLREQGFTLAGFAAWAGGILAERGWVATLATLWISILSIFLAGVLASLLAPFATRTLMTAEPYLLPSDGRSDGPDGLRARTGLGWRAACSAVRVLFILMRAIPEYVLAFLLLAMLGPNAWPVILALALHNAGILGRLGSESLENLDPTPMRSLRMIGASRLQVTWSALRPLGLARFLLYFFYRYETCVREATVLGMLGVVSLGYWIQEARARQRYDEMLLLVALGAGLVLLGDLVSYVARSWVRRA